MKRFLPLILGGFLLSLLLSCSKSVATQFTIPAKDPNVLKIAFGSCSDEKKAQPLWKDIVAESPDLWIWLGDNIYGDTEDMDIMRSKYNTQKSNPGYKALMATCPIIGTWDDHDYGVNDGGKEFTAKAESQQAFLDFLDYDSNDPVRSSSGVYDTYILHHAFANVKVILLDCRYFRDSYEKDNKWPIPNYGGTILGDTQWEWLEAELAKKEADVTIIASGIQVIPSEHRFEKWANFPNEKHRLFDTVIASGNKNCFFISGDRHIGEISKEMHENYPFYDITSSSLTHGWKIRREEPNARRIGDIVYDINYGVIEITKDKDLTIKALLKTKEQKVLSSSILDGRNN